MPIQVKLHLNKLTLKHPFGISHGTYQFRDQLIVEFVAEDVGGYGETVAIDYYGIDINDLYKSAERCIPLIESLSVDLSEREFYERIQATIGPHPFLLCAFDQAFIDLKQQIGSTYVSNFVSEYGSTTIPPSSITIGLNDNKELIEKRLDEAWPIYKVKIGQGDRNSLYEAILSRGSQFGVDANGGYNVGQAQKVYEEVKRYNGEYMEQLIRKEEKEFRVDEGTLANPQLPHLADEAIQTLEQAKVLSSIYDGYVLKLTKCGGITPVMGIIRFAKENDKKLLAGCMTESSIGIGHMRQLLSCFDYADLDGAVLISNDEEVRSITGREFKTLKNDGYFS